MKIMKFFYSGIVTAFFSFNAHSLEGFIGKVTYLEPTYMPGAIRFTVSGGNSTCPLGTAIKWSKEDVENNKVVYSTLLAAFMAGKSVRIYINDNDTSCNAQYIHLLPN